MSADLTTADRNRRFVGAITLVGAVAAIASAVLLGMAFNFDATQAAPDLTQAATDLTLTEPSAAELVRWGALADMIGYYLTSVPLILYLGQRLAVDDNDIVIATATTGGLIYVVTGSIGAVLLASVAPPLIADPGSVGDETLGLITRAVYIGLWQTLEVIPWGLWLVVVGRRLHRTPLVDDGRLPSLPLARLCLLVGVAALTTAVGRILQLESLVVIPVYVAIGGYAVLLWWFGLTLMRSNR